MKLQDMKREKDEYIILDKDVKLYSDQLEIFDKREIKLLLLFDKELKTRDKLKISKNLLKRLQGKNEIELKDNTTFILKGTLNNDVINIDKSENKLEDLLIFSSSEKENYKKQFTIYYKQLLNWFKFNESSKSSSKYSAMMTYISLKDYLKGENISPPNSFIKNNKLEFDMILLNNKSKNRYVYNKDEVKAVFELKTAGVMYPNETFKINVLNHIIYNYISNYVKFENSKYDLNKKITKETTDKKYDVLKEELEKELSKATIEENIPPFIYFTLHESNRPIKDKNNKSRVDLFKEVITDYNETKNKIEKLPKIYCVFCSSKKDNEKFIMDNDETLSEIIEKL